MIFIDIPTKTITIMIKLQDLILEKQAVSGGKVEKFITGIDISIDGRRHKKVEFELVSINNTTKTVVLKILSPKPLFGRTFNIPFRTLRRGPFIKTDTNLSERKFVFHYGVGKDRFAHQLTAFRLKDALKQFIKMYNIPKSKWKDIDYHQSKGIYKLIDKI